MSLMDYGLQKKVANYARCSLCSCDLKYFTQGFQTFTQHSVRQTTQECIKNKFWRE